METVRYVINVPEKNLLDVEWRLLFLGDIHLGNPGCDHAKLQKSIDKIKNDPLHFTMGMGDYVENNNPDNARSLATYDKEMAAIAAQSNLSLVSQQIRAARALLTPIKDKIIGLHVGNHEDRTLSHDEFKLNVTEPLGVNYLGDKAYIALDFVYRGKVVHEYKIVSGHSDFSGQYDGTVGMAAERFYNAYEDFDIFAFGHTHYTFANKKFRKFLDTSTPKPELKLKKYYIVNTGTFLRSEVSGFDAYTDRSFRGGVREVGTATVSFIPSKGEAYAHA